MKRLFIVAFMYFLSMNVLAITPVSLVRIISNGASYMDLEVQVFGYLQNSPAGLRLYLTDHHAQANDIESSVEVILPETDLDLLSDCLSKYVYIQGQVRSTLADGTSINGALRIFGSGDARKCDKREKKN